jgi:hypothetical protein
MSHALVEYEETAGTQIERSFERAQPNVAPNGLDGDSPLRVMSWNPRVRLERDQDDTEVVVFDERLGVLPTRRLRLAVQLLELSREIKLQKRSRHWLRVRSPVLAILGMNV